MLERAGLEKVEYFNLSAGVVLCTGVINFEPRRETMKIDCSLFMLALGVGRWANDVEGGEARRRPKPWSQRQITPPPKQATPPAHCSNSRPRPPQSGRAAWFAPLAGLARASAWAGIRARRFGPAIGALLMVRLPLPLRSL